MVLEVVPVPAVCGFFLSIMIAPYALRLLFIWATNQASSSDSIQPTAFAPTDIGVGKVGS
jgi:hypothetical protein